MEDVGVGFLMGVLVAVVLSIPATTCVVKDMDENRYSPAVMSHERLPVLVEYLQAEQRAAYDRCLKTSPCVYQSDSLQAYANCNGTWLRGCLDVPTKLEEESK